MCKSGNINKSALFLCFFLRRSFFAIHSFGTILSLFLFDFRSLKLLKRSTASCHCYLFHSQCVHHNENFSNEQNVSNLKLLLKFQLCG